jgi:hypothetical protein
VSRRSIVAALSAAVLLAVATPAGAQDATDLEVHADGFDFITNLASAPDGSLFVTEKNLGHVLIVRDGRALETPFATFDVAPEAEQGLLGIALHPDFENEPWVYVYYTDANTNRNRIVRVRAEGDAGGEVEPVVDDLPAAAGYHNGGDITFGPDGMLYAVTGEAHSPERAQFAEDLAGKVLRMTPEGGVPGDNPFGPSSRVYSLGHRNSFGLCIEPGGQVWETENGPSSHDELNRIEPGGNYGWPDVSGPGGGGAFIDPVIDYPEIIVPTGCAVAGGRLWWTDFSGTLHHAALRADGLGPEQRIDVGRAMADVLAAPDGNLYVAGGSVILRMPVPDTSPPTTSPTGPPVSGDSPTPDGASPSPAAGGGAGTISVVVIAVLLALGIIAMRSRIRPPEPPDDASGP